MQRALLDGNVPGRSPTVSSVALPLNPGVAAGGSDCLPQPRPGPTSQPPRHCVLNPGLACSPARVSPQHAPGLQVQSILTFSRSIPSKLCPPGPTQRRPLRPGCTVSWAVPRLSSALPQPCYSVPQEPHSGPPSLLAVSPARRVWNGSGAVGGGLTTRDGQDAGTDGEHLVPLGWGSQLARPVSSA